MNRMMSSNRAPRKISVSGSSNISVNLAFQPTSRSRASKIVSPCWIRLNPAWISARSMGGISAIASARAFFRAVSGGSRPGACLVSGVSMSMR